MFSFFQRGPAFGIEITSQHVRSALQGRVQQGPIVGTADLPAGAAADSYSLPNIDASAVSRTLLQSLSGWEDRKRGRVGLCLPDGVFRIQALDFDELPARFADQERLIRWRLQKSAAFDLADTLLQHQVLRRPAGSITVLACIAKRAVIEQYEAILGTLDLEVWSILPSSLAAVNCYASVLNKRSPTYALTHLTGDSVATVVMEQGGVSFYRFKEVKRGAVTEGSARLARDISDSLHFYTHRDRTQQADLRHLYLNGDAALCESLAVELGAEAPFAVEVLSPGSVLPGAAVGYEFAPALGAGLSL